MQRSPSRITPGQWGEHSPGLAAPSFWIQSVGDDTPLKKSFQLLQSDCSKFWQEYPLLRGAALLSRGSGKRAAAAQKAGLVMVTHPAWAASSGAGAQRRIDERVTLTEKGEAYLRSGNRRKHSPNTVVWQLRFACGGVDSYHATVVASLRAQPNDSSKATGTIATGSIIIAAETRMVGSPPDQAE